MTEPFREKTRVGIPPEASPAGTRVNSASIPHTRTVSKKLDRADTLSVVASGKREDRCEDDRPLGEACGSEAFHAGGLSSLVA